LGISRQGAYGRFVLFRQTRPARSDARAYLEPGSVALFCPDRTVE
jgi:hypothetical protein